MTTGHPRLWHSVLVLLSAVCQLAPAIAAEVQVPVVVTYGGTAHGKANWTAHSDIESFPELNAGDVLRLLRVIPRELKLGIWERSCRRLSHKSCSGFIWRSCKEYYANDLHTGERRFEPLADAVNLRLEFVNRFAPKEPWNKGQYPLRHFVNKPVRIAGPLDAKVESKFETEIPNLNGAGTCGAVQEKRIIGKAAPADWATLVFEVQAPSVRQ